ncbi:MAG TPA: hypothetical protein VMM37_05965 [Bacteroidota bacterium]|nr:hypothetical protein [Bacteroidota bacterium]
MITYRNKFLRIARIWFNEAVPEQDVDIVYYSQRDTPLPLSRWEEFHTIVIDLRQPEKTLFAQFKKDTRNEVRRAAGTDRVVCQRPVKCPSDLLERFYDFYGRFAAQKNRPGVDRRVLNLLHTSGELHISSAESAAGNPLVFHAYYVSPLRVRLLYSASLFRESSDAGERNSIGRSNRCLHWNDMIHFKHDGVAQYDLGGWYAGTTDEEKLRINRFKEEFGGTLAKGYNGVRGLTVTGNVALMVNRLLRDH